MPEKSGLDLLKTSLAAPPVAASIGELLALWRQVEFRITARRPKLLEDLPDLPVRLRGALGEALAKSPAPIRGRHDPFDRPPPFQVLFGDLGSERGRETPRPIVLDADVTSSAVEVRLVVLGQAMFWAQQARDAMIAALAGGITLRSGSRRRVVFEPLELETEVTEGLVCPAVGRDAVLVLRSPLVLRHGRSLKIDAHALTSALHARAEGLARWQGLQLLDPLFSVTSTAKQFTVEGHDLLPIRFFRHSRRQVGRSIPVTGTVGRLALKGNLADLMPYLVIGSVAHVGSHAALGMGRYELAVYG